MPDDAYKQAGVDITAGDAVVGDIAALAAKTHAALAHHNCKLLGGIGSFAGVVQLPGGSNAPILVMATDGVGSKLELARQHNALSGVGQDVVAMCVNDFLCVGAKPLFFLDYIACHKLEAALINEIISGIAAACTESQCALIGGETAEMPSVYTSGKFDLAGFAVGLASQDTLLSPDAIKADDTLIAIASNGVHSNGYALVHHILASAPKLAKAENILSALLTPTRLYCQTINRLREAVDLHGLAHITGGGLDGNLPRIFPPELYPDYSPLPITGLFATLQQAGGIDDKTMRRVFNCGVGMVAVVNADEATTAVDLLNGMGEDAWILGHVRQR